MNGTPLARAKTARHTVLRRGFKPSVILFVLLAGVAALLTACPPEPGTEDIPQGELTVSYCGIWGLPELTLAMGKMHGKVLANKQAVSWSSSDESAVTVAPNGALTLIAVTPADDPVTIAATAEGKTVGFKLNVVAADTTISVTDENGLRAIGCGLDGSYKLANDITLTKEWIPIGDLNDSFYGTLDGDGHTVRNLFIEAPYKPYIGLIGANATNGRVINIGVEVGAAGITANPLFAATGQSTSTGALVGSNNGRVSGFARGGQVSGVEQVGGLVGVNASIGTVVGYATVAVSGVKNYVGGLVGNNGGTATGYATGAVTSDYGRQIGGLVGLNTGTLTGYATGSVEGTGSTGGLVGDNEGGVVVGYARGAITANQGAPADTIAGSFGRLYGLARTVTPPGGSPTGSVTGFYSASTTESQEVDNTSAKNAFNTGGTGITISTATQSSFSGFDFTDDWHTFSSSKWPAIQFPTDLSIFSDQNVNNGANQPI